MAENTEQEAPKIEFPCADYPIKVIGRDGPDFQEVVIEVVRVHVPDLDINKIEIQGSSKGTFTSIRMKITATGHEQLKALHQDLLSTGRVQMVM
ncbi:YbeD family protein [Amphritea sp.]|uniref:YbeD family protein n=1 Tax=Amphritea sp. TaxID=1872502 RepID=UPI003D0A5A39